MKTILVVDDELGSAEVLSLILEEEGYRAFCAVNGQLALIQARDVVPDLVIVDYMMPLMNGAEFARALRADPQFANTKIVLNSGLPEVAIRDQLDTLLDEAARSEMNLREALTFLAEREIARRDARRIGMATVLLPFGIKFHDDDIMQPPLLQRLQHGLIVKPRIGPHATHPNVAGQPRQHLADKLRRLIRASAAEDIPRRLRSSAPGCPRTECSIPEASWLHQNLY